MTENILFADFTDRGTEAARQALAELDLAHKDGDLKLHEARVISRDADGDLDVPGEVDHTNSATGFAVGGLVGALVGLLGGPVGVMIGLGAGGLIGGGRDARRVTEANAALEEISDEVPPGSTVLVADLDEESPAAADQAVGPGARRYLADEFRENLEAALASPDPTPAPGDEGSGATEGRGGASPEK